MIELNESDLLGIVIEPPKMINLIRSDEYLDLPKLFNERGEYKFEITIKPWLAERIYKIGFNESDTLKIEFEGSVFTAECSCLSLYDETFIWKLTGKFSNHVFETRQ